MKMNNFEKRKLKPISHVGRSKKGIEERKKLDRERYQKRSENPEWLARERERWRKKTEALRGSGVRSKQKAEYYLTKKEILNAKRIERANRDRDKTNEVARSSYQRNKEARLKNIRLARWRRFPFKKLHTILKYVARGKLTENDLHFYYKVLVSA